MNYQREVMKVLSQLGVNQSYIGYKFVVYGVDRTIHDSTCLQYISKSLYMDIAFKFQTSWRCVERNIRTVVNVIWKTEDKEMLKLICGNKIIDKPNNKEFFIILANYIISAESSEDVKQLDKYFEITYYKNLVLIKKILEQLELITNKMMNLMLNYNETDESKNYFIDVLNDIKLEIDNVKSRNDEIMEKLSKFKLDK